jgi:hypothetical protein
MVSQCAALVLQNLSVDVTLTYRLQALPTLFDDVNRRMELWGKEGRMDPFKNIYDVCHMLRPIRLRQIINEPICSSFFR